MNKKLNQVTKNRNGEEGREKRVNSQRNEQWLIIKSIRGKIEWEIKEIKNNNVYVYGCFWYYLKD